MKNEGKREFTRPQGLEVRSHGACVRTSAVSCAMGIAAEAAGLRERGPSVTERRQQASRRLLPRRKPRQAGTPVGGAAFARQSAWWLPTSVRPLTRRRLASAGECACTSCLRRLRGWSSRTSGASALRRRAGRGVRWWCTAWVRVALRTWTRCLVAKTSGKEKARLGWRQLSASLTTISTMRVARCVRWTSATARLAFLATSASGWGMASLCNGSQTRSAAATTA